MTSAHIQVYIPEDQWPPVSAMLEGFGDQTLPASPALAGTTLSLPGEDGSQAEYVFDDESSLAWTVSRAGDTTSGTAGYKAIEARPGIFIIDFIRGEGSAAENVTIIADRTRTPDRLTSARHTDAAAPCAAPAHARSARAESRPRADTRGAVDPCVAARSLAPTGHAVTRQRWRYRQRRSNRQRRRGRPASARARHDTAPLLALAAADLRRV